MDLSDSLLKGRYELRQRVGRGGFAEVYRARDTIDDRQVAVKLLLPEHAADHRLVERFRDEARLGRKIRDPNGHVVAVDDYGEQDGRHFLVMEYLDGTSLRAALQDRGSIAFGYLEAATIFTQLCVGLGWARDVHQLAHRDLKPENVFLIEEGGVHVKIIDLGIAKQITAGLEVAAGHARAPTLDIGTPCYMAPEYLQSSGTRDHFRGDVYALGVILHEMLTGLPYEGLTPMSASEAAERGVPDDLWRLMGRCLDLDPQRRFASAAEVRDELLAVRRAWRGPSTLERRGPGDHVDSQRMTTKMADRGRRRTLRVLPGRDALAGGDGARGSPTPSTAATLELVTSSAHDGVGPSEGQPTLDLAPEDGAPRLHSHKARRRTSASSMSATASREATPDGSGSTMGVTAVSGADRPLSCADSGRLGVRAPRSSSASWFEHRRAAGVWEARLAPVVLVLLGVIALVSMCTMGAAIVALTR
ncbi:MAG: serine/threonine-protein kinase [Nannocystaceae bacterium]